MAAPHYFFVGLVFFQGCKVNSDFSEESFDKSDNDTIANADEDKEILTIDDLNDCPDDIYGHYSNKLGISGPWPWISINIEKGMLKEPVIFRAKKISEYIDSKGVEETKYVILGEVDHTEQYIEETGQEKGFLEITIRNFGTLVSEEVFLEKEMVIDQKSFLHPNMYGEAAFSYVESIRFIDDKLLMGFLSLVGEIGFKKVPLDIDQHFPEFKITHDLDGEYCICKDLVELHRRESYYDILYFPDIIIDCSKDGKTMRIEKENEGGL
jgi:hypothetical protein